MLRLGKYQGLGNDFLVALAADNPGLRPDPDLARALCDRRRGVGADGLVLGLAPAVPGTVVSMVLLNSDGSEAEISGNGIRCLGHALLRAGIVTADAGGEAVTFAIDAPAGRRRLRLLGGDAAGEVCIEVDMGPVREGPPLSPAARAYPASRVVTVDVGNPHLVVEVDDPESIDLETDGPALESGFADGINVHFVAPSRGDHLLLRVWERGAGVTEACGSGATAAAVAAIGWGSVSAPVTVEMPGGAAVVEVVDGSARLSGPSVFVADVQVPVSIGERTGRTAKEPRA